MHRGYRDHARYPQHGRAQSCRPLGDEGGDQGGYRVQRPRLYPSRQIGDRQLQRSRDRLAIDSFNDPETYSFELGKGITLHEGNDVTVIASGLVVNEALKAVKELEAEGISARLINIHTIKPIDRDIVIKAAQETGRIITVEEHNVVGGLADAVCEVVTAECPVKVTRIGVQDEFGYSGPAWELLDAFKLTQPHIAQVIRDVVNEK